MTSDHPDKRKRPELPLDTFGDFQYRQALAEEMLPMIGRLYRSNVHLLLYGKPLVNLSVSELMQAHRFVREVENNELSEFETYQVMTVLSELQLGPAEIDVGIIAAAHLFDDKNTEINDFVLKSVGELIGNTGSILDQAQDVVIYGFGRIGRLLTGFVRKTGSCIENNNSRVLQTGTIENYATRIVQFGLPPPIGRV